MSNKLSYIKGCARLRINRQIASLTFSAKMGISMNQTCIEINTGKLILRMCANVCEGALSTHHNLNDIDEMGMTVS